MGILGLVGGAAYMYSQGTTVANGEDTLIGPNTPKCSLLGLLSKMRFKFQLSETHLVSRGTSLEQNPPFHP